MAMPRVWTLLSIIILAAGLAGCGESDKDEKTAQQSAVERDAPPESGQSPVNITETSVASPEEPVPDNSDTAIASTTPGDATEPPGSEMSVPGQVVDEAPAIASSDKPYQLIDGAISQNAIEGWKTYNGGGCGACHGKGGIGAVGPNLGVSVTQKISKAQFIDIITNGKPGTMMRPHNTNKRVMDNLDNLYAYLMARGDDVLGPGNLIKLPLGK